MNIKLFFLISAFVSLFFIQITYVQGNDCLFFVVVKCPLHYVQIAEHAIEEYIDSVTAT